MKDAPAAVPAAPAAPAAQLLAEGKSWKEMWEWGKEMLDASREGGGQAHPALSLLGQ